MVKHLIDRRISLIIYTLLKLNYIVGTCRYIVWTTQLHTSIHSKVILTNSVGCPSFITVDIMTEYRNRSCNKHV